ncbi:hypothetical protein EVAR_62698_1 [Eumeta japonica]|uniref:Uncharacterized protein n=1 Tax=Eumeta variegata TaxID=151549 RepID=A0A4C1ZIH5_EUMVA|nr:hypothetical protein EVAR_62698_1 [Eumeta japonica]
MSSLEPSTNHPASNGPSPMSIEGLRPLTTKLVQHELVAAHDSRLNVCFTLGTQRGVPADLGPHYTGEYQGLRRSTLEHAELQELTHEPDIRDAKYTFPGSSSDRGRGDARRPFEGKKFNLATARIAPPRESGLKLTPGDKLIFNFALIAGPLGVLRETDWVRLKQNKHFANGYEESEGCKRRMKRTTGPDTYPNVATFLRSVVVYRRPHCILVPKNTTLLMLDQTVSADVESPLHVTNSNTASHSGSSMYFFKEFIKSLTYK